MRFIAGLFAGIIIGIVVVAAFMISALRSGATAKPAVYETTIAGYAKLWLVPESSQKEALPQKSEQTILDGGEHYNHRCAVCHDLSGDADSSFATSFHPPVADLLSERVQSYSDGQLKWIIDNGIRYTGMPGWEKLAGDEEQWGIVYYLRILDSPEQKEHYKQLLQAGGKWKVDLPAEHAEEYENGESVEENQKEENSIEHSHSKPEAGAGEGKKNESKPGVPVRNDTDSVRAVAAETRSKHDPGNERAADIMNARVEPQLIVTF